VVQVKAAAAYVQSLKQNRTNEKKKLSLTYVVKVRIRGLAWESRLRLLAKGGRLGLILDPS
jgi:hypothetical protein